MAGPTTARRGGRKTNASRSSDASRASGSRSPRRPPGKRPPGKRRPAALRDRLPRRRTMIAVAVLVAVAAGFGGWALYGSSWLRVTRVTASGTRVLTDDEVVKAAAVPMDTPLVSVDTEAVAARVRAALPRVKTVDIVRSWPHGIGLKVTERTPEVVERTGDGFVQVDDEGVRFATVSAAPQGVPLLVMDADESPSLRRFGIARLRREAAGVIAALPERMHRDVRAVRVRSYDSLTLELTGDRTVAWGSGEQGEAKARVFAALLKAARGARHFDVSVPSAPAASRS
ncbi:FtsQ-type POTRA domain-containing protein [Streptomyces sp. NPDC003077]|uniref:cell division protein FtsQ/DivIB n=1 Tax=Streptomyces sp. NPDC003077 TaxID=3154443 RepID=UPI0033B6AAE2